MTKEATIANGISGPRAASYLVRQIADPLDVRLNWLLGRWDIWRSREATSACRTRCL